MPFGHRFMAGKELEIQIKKEIDFLAESYSKGFVVRLHILGDFYSLAYVSLWVGLLEVYPELHIFGYTAHLPNSPLGNILLTINKRRDLNGRCWIRFSQNEKYDEHYPEYMFAGDPNMVSGLACPEQTGLTESCLTCGLCWSTTKTITFQDADAKNKAKKLLQQ